jgi:preprotein translocase subunit SecA
MPGRRFSDGLHQALEAKEGVKVEAENQTLASITFQNFFRMYDKLAGMTGTADTEAVEFKEIYDLDVSVIPTHKPMIREDHPDAIYRDQEAKFKAIAQSIRELHQKGQPVLVGTVSIDKSELLSKMLNKLRVPHEVLNAKQHEREAEIVAHAGEKGRVTIATNMAGRGTDIKLGEGVVEVGGLHILGTERHESRRIDNQLRGRSGRQGDPGSSRFYLAMDDDLMRLFGSDRLSGIMDRLGMEDDSPIENKMVSRAIENAQRRVEAHNFDIRKQLLEFDDVMNQQRHAIYTRRRELMIAESVEAQVFEAVDELLDDLYEPVEDAKEVDPEDVDYLAAKLEEVFNYAPANVIKEDPPSKDTVRKAVLGRLDEIKAAAPEHANEIFRFFLLDSLDRNWKEHLLNMDHMREGIGLRGYGQKDPKQEYKREGFAMFQDMLYRIQEHSMRALMRLRIKAEVDESEFRHEDTTGKAKMHAGGDKAEAKDKTVKREAPKVGRNDPCPCGSGKKHKKCCGR